ncbi:30S ribosomal protein S16 [Phytoactinopolyspora mesophila]|uniref:Small ribosomal subunit protein bS16 n=1 Tax=Phytoactinopolyspora mesophila TaxID=2650750 RepID=A0A7K3M8P1_9ACTN|nr:30S ribosomal protein S16 [Phytoactinopolyspora mesophila]
MAVKIKLKRMGKIRSPHYRIIVADSRTRRDGRAIEEIGLYNPKLQPSLIKVDSERAQYWLGVGAQPTEPVMAILKVTGDWQKFKGLPGAEGSLQLPEPKADKRAAFDAALAEVHGEPKGEATTPKKKTAKKAAKPKDEKPADKADDAKADDTAAEKPAKKAAKDEKPAAEAKDEKPAAEAKDEKPAAEAKDDTASAEAAAAEPKAE